MKDFDLYRSFYCGLCRELREKYGISGQITLSYDMTFVILLLSGLYEPKTYKGTTRCILHPVRKQPVRKSEVTEYCADMNVLLTYYKCLDDWKDDRKYVKLGYAKLLEGKNNRLLKLYPDKAKRIAELLDELCLLCIKALRNDGILCLVLDECLELLWCHLHLLRLCLGKLLICFVKLLNKFLFQYQIVCKRIDYHSGKV